MSRHTVYPFTTPTRRRPLWLGVLRGAAIGVVTLYCLAFAVGWFVGVLDRIAAPQVSCPVVLEGV